MIDGPRIMAMTQAMETTTTDGKRHFDGETYEPKVDQVRLNRGIEKVYSLMKDGEWRTLDEIHKATEVPHASVSARLRDLRKKAFGGHAVERRRRGDAKRGLFEYKVVTVTNA